jgi:hypothetical protein
MSSEYDIAIISFQHIIHSFIYGAEPFLRSCQLCHHGMARPQVADGGDALQVWRIKVKGKAVPVLN